MRKNNHYILWLPSWYPNQLAPFDGDFIQRHAQAAALFSNIYVIRIVSDEKGAVTKNIRTEIREQDKLTEHIVYYKRSGSSFGKIFATYKEINLYRQAIKNCIKEYGKPYLVHVHVAMRAGLFALWLKRKYKVPFLISEHWTIFQPGKPDEFAKRSFFFKISSRRIIRRAHILLTVSHDLGQRLSKIVIPKKFHVIPNVANETFFYYKPVRLSKFRFIHVSDMSYQKNAAAIIDNFVTVLKSFPDIELVLVGSINTDLFNVVKNMGLLNKTVFFRGEIAYEKVATELQDSNALVLFSHFENQPCVIIEALCCGVPVVSSPVGGIPEIINYSNGVLTTGVSKYSLAEAMQRMIRDYDLFDPQKISADARSKFAYRVVGKMFYDVYNSDSSEIDLPGI